MNKRIFVKPQDMAQIFKTGLADDSNIFVFPTDVVMNSWIDWCVLHSEESGVSAVPLERFIAWDKFKGNYVSASEPGKSPVPALLRKIFVRNLIQKMPAKNFSKRLLIHSLPILLLRLPTGSAGCCLRWGSGTE